MTREDFEKARELDNVIEELKLKADSMLKMATRLKKSQCSGVIDFGNAIPAIRVEPEDLAFVAEIYHKRFNEIQRQIGELLEEFHSI